MTRRPPRRTSPDVGSSRPTITLKKVVLPAPFGPMRLRIEPRAMARSTSRTARRPPNRFEILRASRMFSPASAAAGVDEGAAGAAAGGVAISAIGRHRRIGCVGRQVAALRLVQLALPAPAREETFGPEQHHPDERDSVEQELVLDEVDVLQDRDVIAVDELVELLQEHAL